MIAGASIDLRQEAREVALAWPEDVKLSDEERAAAITEWHGRMVNEHISARVFAALIPQMMKAGIGATEQAAVAAMTSQELRHGRLCAAVVQALGGQAVSPLPSLPEVPAHEDAPPLEGLLRNLIAISCLNETVAVALIESGRQRVAIPCVHGVMTEILRDEVQHARVGWKLLAQLAPGIDVPTRERLGDYLVPAFRQLFERHYAPIDAPPSLAVHELGVDDHGESTRLFVDTVTQAIVPGLERHGLPARAALAAALSAS